MQQKKISIITPIFNRKHLIDSLIKTVLEQTYKNWELIIVDDHSTDGTIEYLKEKYQYERRIRVELRKNSLKGANSCRNQGIQNSTGEFLMFLDSDDLLFDFCLSQRIALLIKNPAFDFLVFNGVFGNKSGIPINLLWNIENEEKDIIRFIKSDSVWSVSGGIFKKEFLISNNLSFDEKLFRHQDVDFHIQILLKNPRYQRYLELEPDYIIRRHGAESVSQEKNADFSISGAYIAKKILFASESLSLKEKKYATIKLNFEINHLFLRKHLKLGFQYLNLSQISIREKSLLLFFWLFSAFSLKLFKEYPKRCFGVQLWKELIKFEQLRSSIGKHQTTQSCVN